MGRGSDILPHLSVMRHVGSVSRWSVKAESFSEGEDAPEQHQRSFTLAVLYRSRCRGRTARSTAPQRCTARPPAQGWPTGHRSSG